MVKKSRADGKNTVKILEYELEPGILESKVRWAMEALANSKAPGHDGIPIECFKY